jgi:hypothetical protein
MDADCGREADLTASPPDCWNGEFVPIGRPRTDCFELFLLEALIEGKICCSDWFRKASTADMPPSRNETRRTTATGRDEELLLTRAVRGDSGS